MSLSLKDLVKSLILAKCLTMAAILISVNREIVKPGGFSVVLH